MSTLPRLSRRDWLKLSAAGVVAHSASGWLENLANAAAGSPIRKRACILLWMNGGAAQTDTFDLKPGHKHGGPYKEIATNVPGIKIGEHLPRVAKHVDRMAIVRSMTTKEQDHQRAAYYLRTGYLPQGGIQYPALGAALAKEMGDDSAALPNFVSIAPAPYLSPGAYSSGFLGPRHQPLFVGNTGFGFGQQRAYEQLLKVQDLVPPREVADRQVDSRLDLLRGLQGDFEARHPGVSPQSHREAYQRAVRLMKTDARKAFDLHEEKDALRDAYGRNLFGQGCLLARRLIERGVPFVEVTLSSVPGAPQGWDTHDRNFDQVKALCNVLDPAWSTLMKDLQDRALLNSTLIVWMGEFGRTPIVNGQRGRDHFPDAWTTVLAGGGIKGGQVYGKSTPDGMKVAEKAVSVPNFLATVTQALGVDPTKQNMSNVGRPIRIADAGSKPIKEVLA